MSLSMYNSANNTRHASRRLLLDDAHQAGYLFGDNHADNCQPE